MVTFINCFEVPAGRDEEFLSRWGEVNAYMRDKEGFLDHTLNRSVSHETHFRYVNIAHWAGAAEWRAAHDEGFRRLVQQPEWAEFPSTPGLFEPVHSSITA